MTEIIWCKKCDTVNYLDPYIFWNFKGNVKCAECGTIYYVHLINGFYYEGPTEVKEPVKDYIMPLYADKPYDGYSCYLPGTPERTRPYVCLPSERPPTGKPYYVKFSIRGRPVRGWAPQPPSTGLAGSAGFKWEIEKLSPEVWKEYQEKLKRGEVREW
uniref:Uncharacterized protein n=1 Tax=Archaeoglobus fulgidus TaxID=2234 RepID=A0A7J3M1Z9_ARCFL